MTFSFSAPGAREGSSVLGCHVVGCGVGVLLLRDYFSEDMHQQKVAQIDSECGSKCWTFAQNHKAHSTERRSADLGERRRGCQVAGLL